MDLLTPGAHSARRARPAGSVLSGLARAALMLLSLGLMSSIGGGFLALPLLLPFHAWAALGSNAVMRWIWSVIAGLGLGLCAWAAVYELVGEAKPAIWLVPLLTIATTVVAMGTWARRRRRLARRHSRAHGCTE